MRKRLNKELGYTFSIEGLSCLKAECFAIIANEIDRIDEAKKPKGRGRRG